MSGVVSLIEDAPAAWDVWGPTSDDPDVNTAQLRGAIQRLARRAQATESAGMATLVINSQYRSRNIKVRPNIAPDLPAGITATRLQGLRIIGAGRRYTMFEVIPDGVPSAAYYFWNPCLYDVAAETSRGLYARPVFEGFGVCPLGGGVSANMQSLYPATLTDDGSQPYWEHFRGWRLWNWSKEPTLREVYAQGMRYVVEAGYSDATSTTGINGDTGTFDGLETYACGTTLWTRHIQAMAWNFTGNCQFTSCRRDVFRVSAGGEIHVDAKFLGSDYYVVPSSYSSFPYVSPYWVFLVDPDCASSMQNGGYTLRMKAELHAGMGLFKSVPTNSGDYDSDPESDEYADYLAALSDERRERVLKVHDTTISTLANPQSPLVSASGKRGGVPRVIAQVGLSQRLHCENVAIGQTIPGNIQQSDRDWPIFQAVVTDKPIQSGGSASQFGAASPPQLWFDDCHLPRNFKRNCIETVRHDGTPGTGALVDVQIDRPRYFDEGDGDVWPYRRERFVEEGRWIGAGGCMARATAPVTVNVLNGRETVPGDETAIIERIYFPAPVEILSVETYLAALGSGGPDASWRLVDKNGDVYGATPTGDALALHYALESFPRTGEAPVIFESREDWLEFQCSTAGTVAGSQRRAYCNVTYRPLNPHYNSGTAQTAPDLYRTDGPYSRLLAKRIAHNWRCDDQQHALGIFVDSSPADVTDARDSGFTGYARVLDALGTAPANTLDGTLSRYVKQFSSVGNLQNLSAGLADFDLSEDFTIFAWFQYADTDSAADFVWKFWVDSSNEISMGPRTSSANNNIKLRVKVGGSTTDNDTAASVVATWYRSMFRKNSAGWQLYLGGVSPAASGGDPGWAQGSFVEGVGIGGYAGAGRMTGKVAGVAAAVNHYASDADYDRFRSATDWFAAQHV